MEEENENLTWQQLLEFCNSLPEEFLSKSVTLLHGDETHTLSEVAYFDQDLYIHKDNPENGGPLEDLKDADDFDINDYRFQPKGWPFVATSW